MSEKEEAIEKAQKLREAYNPAMIEGKKVTEQEFYDTFLDTHKHNA